MQCVGEVVTLNAVKGLAPLWGVAGLSAEVELRLSVVWLGALPYRPRFFAEAQSDRVVPLLL
jgi:hypothetical protein